METQVELRGMTERWVIDTLDAVAIARGMSRIDLVNMILRDYASRRLHESKVIEKVVRNNPQLMDQAGRGAE